MKFRDIVEVMFRRDMAEENDRFRFWSESTSFSWQQYPEP